MNGTNYDPTPWLTDDPPLKTSGSKDGGVFPRWNIWRFVDAVWGGAETFAEASRIARGGTNDG